MSGLLSTFNVAKRGMTAQQTALQVVSHNIANANTDGYSVQRADIKTTEPFGMPSLTTATEPGQLGTGSEVASITRSRDEFLDSQIRKESSTLDRYQSRDQFLSEIESIFNEPSDTGLSTTMGQFWDAWNQLSTNPESSTSRTLVANNGQDLADAINHNYQQLEDLKANSADIINQQDFEVSGILKQIRDLNNQIKAVTISGQTPNDLMDNRDLLLDQLSSRFNFDIEKTNFGGVDIKAKVNGNTIDILSSDYTNKNLSMGFVNSVNYYIDSATTGTQKQFDSTDIQVLNMDSNQNPQVIQTKGVPISLLRDTSGSITGINVDGVALNSDGKTVGFGDGKQITINTLGGVTDFQVGSNHLTYDSASGQYTYNGANVNNTNGTLTDPNNGNVLLDGLKVTTDASGNFTINYMNKDVDYNSSTGSLQVNSRGEMIGYNPSGNGDIGISDSNGTTTINNSALVSGNVRAEAVIYMNGDINQTMKIENISLSDPNLSMFTSSHSVLFNNDNYENLKNQLGFKNQIDGTGISSFGFVSANFDNGSLSGYESVSKEVDKYQAQLNNLAKVIAISVNTIHSDNGKSLDFFDTSAETGAEPAKLLKVNSDIIADVSKINASKDLNGNTGNGERALLIGQLRNTKMDILNINDRTSFMNDVNLQLDTPDGTPLSMTSSATGATMDSYFKNTVSDLGISSQEAKRMVTNQTNLLDQLKSRRESVSGVSLDEEMTNMIQFQKGYEANAKIISVVDQLLDVVVNGLIK